MSLKLVMGIDREESRFLRPQSYDVNMLQVKMDEWT